MHFFDFLKIYWDNEENYLSLHPLYDTVVIAQLVRATDCGSVGRGFESRFPPEYTDYKCFLF